MSVQPSAVGTFIVSLDCEGKWGMADHLEPYHHRLLTEASLRDVYDRFLALFARYEVPATFAYVMAFTLSEKERESFAHVLQDDGRGDPWLRYYWDALRRGQGDGWFQPYALDAVKQDGRHEIACHGFCHRSLGWNAISEADARAELALALEVARMKKVTLRTLIFPRNEVGHLGPVRDAGFIGYREKLSRPHGALGQAARLLEEFNIRPRPQPAETPAPGELVRIPPGYFFNWRFGPRRRVPIAVTVARWKALLRRCAEQGGVAHLWLHPHNLITAPDTAESLEKVLAHASDLRDSGRIEILTQEQYCDRLAFAPAEASAHETRRATA